MGTVAFEVLKDRIHLALVDRLDLQRVGQLQGDVLRKEVRIFVERYCDTENPLLNRMERERLIEEVLDEALGFGPLEILLKDPTITTVEVIRPAQIYVQRRGRLEPSDVKFQDAAHLLRIVDRLLTRAGLHKDARPPVTEFRLPDGTLGTIALPPVAPDGPLIHLRRPAHPWALDDLVRGEVLRPEMAQLLEGAVRAGVPVLLSGRGGAGGAGLLRAVAGFTPADALVAVIEDQDALDLGPRPVLRFRAERGADPAALVRQVLRLDPEWLVLARAERAAVADVCAALATGRPGLVAAVAGTGPREALAFLESQVRLAHPDLPAPVARALAANLCPAVLAQLAELPGGGLRVVRLAEAAGLDEAGTWQVRDLVTFRGPATFWATGRRPTFLPRLEAAGLRLPEALGREGPLERDGPGPG
jgi:pilus assembly protein CpaF